MGQMWRRSVSVALLTMTLVSTGIPGVSGVITARAATDSVGIEDSIRQKQAPATAVLDTSLVAPNTPGILMNGQPMPANYADPAAVVSGPGANIKLKANPIRTKPPKPLRNYNNNTRDLGGYVTADGKWRIKPKRLIRSATLWGLLPTDQPTLLAYDLKHIIDFRISKDYTGKKKDVVIPNVDDQQIAIYTPAEDDLSGGDHYTGYFENDATARNGYHQFLTQLLQNKTGATLFHCSNGKDRTGLAVVILMTIFGMSNETIIKDFMLSNAYTPDDKKVDYTWLQTYFKIIDQAYGSMRAYIASPNGLNFSTADQQQLRQEYLEPNPVIAPSRPTPPVVSRPQMPTVSSEAPVAKKPATPATPAISTLPTSTGDLTSPVTTTRPRTPHIKIVHVKKIKRGPFVHLKGHRAYFYDMHLKHRVGTTGKTGKHPHAKWRIIKQAQIRIGNKVRKYVEVKSPRGLLRWLLYQDTTILK